MRGARERFDRVLALDRAHFGARAGLGSCSVKAGDDADARRRFEELAADPKLHAALRLSAEESLADLDLATGQLGRAVERYRRIAAGVADDDRLRTLDVKASPENDRERAAIASLLVGDPRIGRDFGEAAALIGEWSAAAPDDGLPEYLLGRNFYNSGRYQEAARRLDRALAKKQRLPRVEREALRLRVVVACALDDRPRAAEAFARYRSLPGVEPAARVGVEQMARRCGLQ